MSLNYSAFLCVVSVLWGYKLCHRLLFRRIDNIPPAVGSWRWQRPTSRSLVDAKSRENTDVTFIHRFFLSISLSARCSLVEWLLGKDEVGTYDAVYVRMEFTLYDPCPTQSWWYQKTANLFGSGMGTISLFSWHKQVYLYKGQDICFL